jgi:HEAT repeat protein
MATFCFEIGDGQMQLFESKLEKNLKKLGDEKSDVREEAAEALGAMGDKRAVPNLLHALDDENLKVRKKVIEALGEIRDESAVPRLVQALEDESSRTVWEVEIALGKIGDKRAVATLIKILRKNVAPWRWSGTPLDHLPAVWALGELGDASAVDTLVEIMDSQQPYSSDEAAGALSKIEGPEGEPPFLRILYDRGEYSRWRVALAMGEESEMGRSRSVDTQLRILSTLVKDQSASVRTAATNAINKIQSRKRR